MKCKLQIRIDEKLRDELKQHVLDNKTNQTTLVTRYIIEGLKRDKNQTTLTEIE